MAVIYSNVVNPCAVVIWCFWSGFSKIALISKSWVYSFCQLVFFQSAQVLCFFLDWLIIGVIDLISCTSVL